MLANGDNTMTLTCITDSSSPSASITWYIDGQRVNSNKILSHTDGDYGGRVTSQELEFVPLRHMDGEQVECIAFNELSMENTAFSSVALELRCNIMSHFYFSY